MDTKNRKGEGGEGAKEQAEAKEEASRKMADGRWLMGHGRKSQKETQTAHGGDLLFPRGMRLRREVRGERGGPKCGTDRFPLLTRYRARQIRGRSQVGDLKLPRPDLVLGSAEGPCCASRRGACLV